MPKPDLTVIDARKIIATSVAWTKTGTAVAGFYTESEKAEGNDYTKHLTEVMELNNYCTVREQIGTFLFMCMAGQTNADGTPTYNMEDIYDPDKLHEEKARLRKQLEELLTPAPADAKQDKIDEVNANRKTVDTYFSIGVKRACERLSEYANNSLKHNDVTELMKPEASALSFFVLTSLTNAVQNSYDNVKGSNRVLREDGLVARLKDIGFDLEAYTEEYEGMATYTSQLSQTMINMKLLFEGKEVSTLIGIEDYIGFASIINKYKKNPDASLSTIFTSATRDQVLSRANEGQQVSLEDLSPNEIGMELASHSTYLDDEDDLDAYIYAREAIGNYIKTHQSSPTVQRMQSYMEAYRDIVFNSTDPEYCYGIYGMYMNGRLYPNTTYSADFELKDTSNNPDVKNYTASFENIAIKFDNVLDRKNVLKEAFLSELDIEPYVYAPINDEDKEISVINDERLTNITELKNTIDGLKPLAGASDEWKEMLYAVERAKKISDDYQKNYAALEADADAAKRQAALEKVAGAMELARNAARNYVVHKLDSGKFTEGKDYQRLKVAKKLENFGKQQSAYLNSKVVENYNLIHEDKGYFNEKSMTADIANIGKYSSDLFKLRQKTTFISDEFNAMMHSIHQLQNLQSEITNNKEYNAEKDILYFGGVDETGKYRKGYIDRAIERIDDYIAHRRKEGITKDLYADRVDAAGRLKRYLKTIKAGADRTREERMEEHAYNKSAGAHKDAFKKKYDAAKQVLIDNYTTIRDEVAADKLPAVKDAICTVYAYQKYKNEMELIEAGELDKNEASYALKVDRGEYNDIINDFKEKQAEKDSYLNRNAQKTSFIKDILKENTINTVIQGIDQDIADRRPISEEDTFKSVKILTENAIANYKATANEKQEGEIDARNFAKFIVQKSMLVALDNIAKLPAKDLDSKDKLADISVNSTTEKVNGMARKINDSEELKAIVDIYSGQKNIGDKFEAMYQDYAQLKVYTANHDGEMPDNVEKYLQDARTKSNNVNKAEENAKNTNANDKEVEKEAKAVSKNLEQPKQLF